MDTAGSRKRGINNIALALVLVMLVCCACQRIQTGTDSVILEPEPTPWRDPTVREEREDLTAAGETLDIRQDGSAGTMVHNEDTSENLREQPPLLEQAMQEQKLEFSALTGRQLLMVYARPQGTQLYCYEKTNGKWELQREISYLRAYIAKNGLNAQKTEGDGTTPCGLFPLLFAFGHEPEADTQMEYRQIVEETYWVEDPSSFYYNQWVSTTEEPTWSEAEDLSQGGARYNLALAVGYNYGDSVIKGAGSGIFVQCGYTETNGSICMQQINVERIVKWLDQSASPQILISGENILNSDE